MLKNKRISLLLFAVVLVLAACGSQENDPVAEPEPTSSDLASSPVTTQEDEEMPDPTLEAYPADGQKNMPAEPYPAAGDEAYPAPPQHESGPSSSAAYPVEVDLSAITPQPPEDSEPQEAPAPGVPDPQAAIVQQLSQQLAGRLGLEASEVTEVEVEEVEWPDSSLGCPEEGMAYLMVITPGYKVILEAAGETYNFHTNLRGAHVLCGEDGRPVSE